MGHVTRQRNQRWTKRIKRWLDNVKYVRTLHQIGWNANSKGDLCPRVDAKGMLERERETKKEISYTISQTLLFKDINPIYNLYQPQNLLKYQEESDMLKS